jgi:hypothetical protein
MPFAVTLRLDPVSAALVENLWRTLAATCIDTDRQDLGYAAHITLAIYPDDVSADALLAALKPITACWHAPPVTLSGIGVFPGASSILWAAPVVTHDLLGLHASLSDALPDLPVHPHYRRQAWVPHVTLTGPLPDPEPARSVLQQHWRPVSGFLVQADLVRFRPVEVLWSRSLPTEM